MEYVISKTLVGVIIMPIAYFIGSMLGGKIAGLPFELIGATTSNIVMCMLAKSLLVAVFVPLYLLMSVIAPLDAGIMNVILCLAGGVLFNLQRRGFRIKIAACRKNSRQTAIFLFCVSEGRRRL